MNERTNMTPQEAINILSSSALTEEQHDAVDRLRIFVEDIADLPRFDIDIVDTSPSPHYTRRYEDNGDYIVAEHLDIMMGCF